MRVPTYRLNKSKNRGFVEYKGKRRYLPGAYNSPESRQAYNEFIARVKAGHEVAEVPANPTVADLLWAYKQHLHSRFGPRGSDLNHLKRLAPFVSEYFNTKAQDFGSKLLKEVRKKLVEANYGRHYINLQINRLRRCFAWGVEEEMIPGDRLTAMWAVKGLATGEGGEEPQPVTATHWRAVSAVLPYLPRPLRALVLVHWLTGARSGELCSMTMDQIDTSEPVWVYWPRQHKMKRKVDEGKHEHARFIPLGPRCQRLIRYCQGDRGPDQPVFTTEQSRRPYTTKTYLAALTRGFGRLARDFGHRPLRRGESIKDYCEAVGIEYWHPHQLRHTRLHDTMEAAALQAAEEAGLKAAQAVGNHRSETVSRRYTGKSLKLAMKLAR